MTKPSAAQRKESLNLSSVEEAVQQIIPYVEGTRHKIIYFDGWSGLGASAVLREIAQHPPPSLAKRFDKIIHIDCSRWRNRRALQMAIAEELQLPRHVMEIFDRHDTEDDFDGVPVEYRADIQGIRTEIFRATVGHTCLVVFHNGSDQMVDLAALGVFSAKVLWTFRGRLRLNQQLDAELDISHLYLDSSLFSSYTLRIIVEAEANDIVQHAQHKQGISAEVAAMCCVYFLELRQQGGNIMDYNWAIHASNYWVCDGVIEGAQDKDEDSWDVGDALHQELRLEDYSSVYLDLSEFARKPWVFAIDSIIVPPETTSFFLATKIKSDPPLLASLSDCMFRQSDKLRVLKLCHCTFSFTTPPFRFCRSLRFLGLDCCKDQQQGQKMNQERLALGFFGSLWVVDICHTDWELDLTPEIIEQMGRNTREVHIKDGSIQATNLTWRQLHNLRKLRIIAPTCSWEACDTDDFTDLGKLEVLDLSGNNTMQILPCMAGATSLKTLVLDGCVKLEHVGPKKIPSSLESFSFNAGSVERSEEEAKISCISLVGCARLVNLELGGSFPNLEELDLSGTSIKTLDLRDEMVKVIHLEKIILLGCGQLRSILWPEGGMPKLRVLCIDTQGGGGGGEVSKISTNYLVGQAKKKHCHTYMATMDIRFVQSLMIRTRQRFCWEGARFRMYICICYTNNKNNGETGAYSNGQITGLPHQNPSVPHRSCLAYHDVAIDEVAVDHHDSDAPQFQPLDRHLEIREGIGYTENMESVQQIDAIIYVIDQVESLHVHDNSSIPCALPEYVMTKLNAPTDRYYELKQCCVERCRKLNTVFTIDYWFGYKYFCSLETFWAADLPMARYIWSKGWDPYYAGGISFVKLRSIHLYSCPRLVSVLPLTVRNSLLCLETLHIVNCGALRHVFPTVVIPDELIAIDLPRATTLQFPELRRIYLHDLFSLEQISEAKMCAPKLERIRVRGCWGFRHLPAVGANRTTPVIVDGEKDWWEKLEWDGADRGHCASLFKPLHRSRHYNRKPLLRGSVLR